MPLKPLPPERKEVPNPWHRQYMLTLHRVKDSPGQRSAAPSFMLLRSDSIDLLVSTRTRTRTHTSARAHSHRMSLLSKDTDCRSLFPPGVTQLACTGLGPVAPPLQSRMYCRQPWGGGAAPFLVGSPTGSPFGPAPYKDKDSILIFLNFQDRFVIFDLHFFCK